MEDRSVANTPIAGELEALRREVLAHCYRLAGSLNDAEDIVQETYLRAWQGIERFRNRESLRNWLLQLATSVSAEVLKDSPQRVLPPATPTSGPPVEGAYLLDPLPNAVVWGWDLASSELDAVAKESLALPLIAAAQTLPSDVRAAWVLTHILNWPQATVSETLDLRPQHLTEKLAAIPEELEQVRSELPTYVVAEDVRAQLASAYSKVFTDEDSAAAITDVAPDLTVEIPADDFRTMSAAANGVHPVVALYRAGETGYDAYQLHQLTLQHDRIVDVTVWNAVDLFRVFGLPAHLNK